jgi:hypothetical protein
LAVVAAAVNLNIAVVRLIHLAVAIIDLAVLVTVPNSKNSKIDYRAGYHILLSFHIDFHIKRMLRSKDLRKLKEKNS